MVTSLRSLSITQVSFDPSASLTMWQPHLLQNNDFSGISFSHSGHFIVFVTEKKMQTTLSISAVLYPATPQRRLFQRNRKFEYSTGIILKSALNKRLCTGTEYGAWTLLTSPWGMTRQWLCPRKKLEIVLSEKSNGTQYVRVSKDNSSNGRLRQFSYMYSVESTQIVKM